MSLTKMENTGGETDRKGERLYGLVSNTLITR